MDTQQTIRSVSQHNNAGSNLHNNTSLEASGPFSPHGAANRRLTRQQSTALSKLTRCDSRDAETAEDEQQKSLHLSNARLTCGPIYSGRRCCALLGLRCCCCSAFTESRQLLSTSDSALQRHLCSRALSDPLVLLTLVVLVLLLVVLVLLLVVLMLEVVAALGCYRHKETGWLCV
ncbi:unnamed protein product [Pleuronectes platessa]|uniref:Uncharacterized protein n=1 Tax=Pleuronectes platessa TaxID=8262 RepID=A0A9N7ZFB9_PLEPL|nr:unnamed protein product [Pleuronectes platessa]